jgi:hypothetical protein
MTKTEKKLPLTKITFFGSKIAIHPKASIRTFKIQEKPSALKRRHPALQNMKFLHFFQFLWVIFALLDPDPHPDPKTCLHRRIAR